MSSFEKNIYQLIRNILTWASCQFKDAFIKIYIKILGFL